MYPCTKECILLYKTNHSFVQKNDLFCTTSQKHHSSKIKTHPREKKPRRIFMKGAYGKFMNNNKC